MGGGWPRRFRPWPAGGACVSFSPQPRLSSLNDALCMDTPIAADTGHMVLWGVEVGGVSTQNTGQGWVT